MGRSMHVVWQTWHEPFGAAVALNEDPDGDGTNVVLNLRFSRQYYDAETGLHYNWHRYYDPIAGRYLEPDPRLLDTKDIETPINYGLLPFTYANNSPFSVVDPTGQQGLYQLFDQIDKIILSIRTNPNPLIIITAIVAAEKLIEKGFELYITAKGCSECRKRVDMLFNRCDKRINPDIQVCAAQKINPNRGCACDQMLPHLTRGSMCAEVCAAAPEALLNMYEPRDPE